MEFNFTTKDPKKYDGWQKKFIWNPTFFVDDLGGNGFSAKCFVWFGHVWCHYHEGEPNPNVKYRSCKYWVGTQLDSLSRPVLRRKINR